MGFLKCIRYHNIVPLYCFFLPINEKVSTLLIFVCITALLAEFCLGSIRPSWNRQLLVLPAFFLMYLASILLFSGDYSFKWLELRASFIALPLIFLGRDNIRFRKTGQFFICGCVTAYLLCLGYALFKSLNLHSGQLHFNPLLNDSRGFLEAIVYEGNYFFAEHFSVLIQTSYFGFYLTIALSMIIIYRLSFFIKNITILFGIILLAGIIQTMSLAAFGGLFITIVTLSLHLVKTRSKRWIIYILLAGMVTLGFFAQPKFRNMVKDIFRNEIRLDPGERYGIMLRFLSWDASMAIIKEHPIFGVGLINAQKEIMQKYKDKDYIYPLKRNLNSHNQFLQIMVECGTVGLFLVVAMFYFLFRKASLVPFSQKALIRTFAIVLLFNFIFESYFNRYIGLSIVCFFYGLLITLKEENRADGIRS